MAKKTKKKPAVLIVKDPKTRRVLWRINKQTRRGMYNLNPAKGQHQYVRRIVLSGFAALPSGLRRDGGGLPSRGYLLLKQLATDLGNYRLAIDAAKPSSITRQRGTHSIVINHKDLRLLLSALRTINARRFEEQRSEVLTALHRWIPRTFRKPPKRADSYRGDTLARLLSARDIAKKLSPQDVDSLGKFFPQFLRQYEDRIKGVEKLIAVTKNKKAAEVVYVGKIIKEYERRLRAGTHKEQAWQDFLREYILIFNSNYANTLEKESISLHGRYPDFLMIDAYNYLDIYEIKKPNTPLLKKDKSRGNYYWSAELAKAISQVENYIAYAERNADTLQNEIRKRKGIEVRVMKPRGIIIAGTRAQLKGSEVIEDNLRLLNNSLKNVEVILYDELLASLKNFLTRLRKEA